MNGFEGVKQKKKLLRWAGSKSQSEQDIAPYLDFERTYIEPFCGSASFFFSRMPKSAVLNDSNRNLIEFYETLASAPEDLWLIYNEIGEDKETYYEVRRLFNGMDHSIEKSAYFLFLNHYCFNGLYRTNKLGEFNTPFGKHGLMKSKMSLASLSLFAKAAQSARFDCLDFEDFLCRLAPVGACIFVDPPYFTEDNRVFAEYGSTAFCSSDLSRLYRVVKELSQDNLIVLTYKDCSEFRMLFHEMIVGTLDVTRNIGGFAGRRKRESELIALAQPT